jgi:UDP-glucose 4-epimerase
MKKILITGKNSYVGTSFEQYLTRYGEAYSVTTLDMLDGGWRAFDFSEYDVVFHVAGIAHSDMGRASAETKELYYRVNSHLTAEVARKAKTEGVGQFIFMSSAIVYGDSAPIGKDKTIMDDTPVMPANFYGDSKVKAEEAIIPLDCPEFKVVILRPPMIYGRGSKGNYPLLSRLADKLPFFPYVENKRSMLYIDNLCEFVRLMVENGESGIFHPQNGEYSNTSLLVAEIAAVKGKKMLLLKGFGWAVRLLGIFTGLVNKAFGNLAYDMSLSEYKDNYRVCDLKTSIENTEKSYE